MKSLYTLLGVGLISCFAFAEPPYARVAARATFELVATNDNWIEVRFDHRLVGTNMVANVEAYKCDYESMTYEITMPDGRTFLSCFMDSQKTTGLFTASSFNLNDYKRFDRTGANQGLQNQRRFFWKQQPGPDLSQPGTYAFREIGTFSSANSSEPVFTYTSTVARCIVDPSALAKDQLTSKVLRSLGFPSSINPTVGETTNYSRIIWFTLRPPDGSTISDRQGVGHYVGMVYTILCTPSGDVISVTNQPNYIVE